MENKIVGYCMRCKQKREINNAEEIGMKAKGNKTRKAVKGICSVCGTKMFKILSVKKEENSPIQSQPIDPNPEIEKEVESFDNSGI